jgi:hypothetical protein
MKRRTFVVVGGLVAVAGCYALAERDLVSVDVDADGIREELEDLAGEVGEEGPGGVTTDEPAGEAGIAIGETEFVPGSPEPGDRGCLQVPVTNVGGERLSSVTLRPTFFDRQGQPVRGSYLSIVNLDPGETWLACDRYPGSGSEVGGHVVTGSFLPGSTVTPLDGVEVLDERFEADECRVAVSGVVRNVGSQVTPYVQVLARFYSTDGTVVASGHDHTLDLGAGESWDYRVEVDTAGLAERATDHAVELSGPWW